jgi:tRNA threonylcarbamoyladenosine biosynthesis protein TsaE
MNKNKISYLLDDIPSVARRVRDYLGDSRVITFTGPLGAGKTTLVKELLKQYGVTDVVTSPTFTYVNLYENNQGQRFYHFDLYRIETLDQFLEAGFDEYLNQPNALVFIEWPEPIASLLKENVCHIVIEYTDDGRILTLN